MIWQHIKAWWSGRNFPYHEIADEQDFWSEKDAYALNAFLETHAGKKLKMRLQNYTIRSAMEAVCKPNNTQYEIGKAAGIQIGIAMIGNHSAKPEEEQTATESELAYE